ncbi:pre-mRNA-splicing factor rse1 [Savitreella phatthalungensis]
MSTHPDSAFYALSLVDPSTPVCAPVLGHFSGGKQQELAVATCNALSIYRIDNRTGKLRKLLFQRVYATIRSIAAFRLAGTSQDHLIIGSDSGRVTALQFDAQARRLKRIHCESFGRSGARRVVPGQYTAADPKGRAVMLAAIEKNKLAYVLNRDAEGNMTISSPLEVSTPGMLVYHMVALDVGYDNPVYAVIELNHKDTSLEDAMEVDAADQPENTGSGAGPPKVLSYYELDLGLNNVVRAWMQPIERDATHLVSLPGGYDGPGGVLVCSPGRIEYRHKNRPLHVVQIPRRHNTLITRKSSIVSSVTHKLKGSFFVLLQTDAGDLFKLSADHEEGALTSLTLKYFDTLPVARGLTIFKAGYLYAACESGGGRLYQFEKLGEDDNEIEVSSRASASELEDVQFTPRELVNLSLQDELDSFGPMLDMAVVNFTKEDASQVYALCGKRGRSTLETIRHELQVNEVIASELPGSPTGVWTTKLRQDDEYDSYMVLSFLDATLVLSIGESVEELSDTGLSASTQTLAVQQLGKDALIQIHPRGIRHIQSSGHVNEWSAPQHRTIVQATSNNRQVVLALSSGELIYFELDADEQLNEYEERKDVGGNVTALAIGAVPEGLLRNPYLAVACDDSTVRVLSLDPDNTLESLSLQALTAPASSLLMMQLDSAAGVSSGLYLHIGLNNGVYLRTSLELSTGQLMDTRTRFLGPSPVGLTAVRPAPGVDAVMATSTRPWLGYTRPGEATQLLPLHYDVLHHGAGFSSEDFSNGLVGIRDNTLCIFTVNDLDHKFKRDSLPLRFTPRKMCRHPIKAVFYVLEADHHAALSSSSDTSPGEVAWAPERHWASCIRVVDPVTNSTLSELALAPNEAAFSATVLSFASRPGKEQFLAVGCAIGASLMPKTCVSASIHLYAISGDGRRLTLVHKTDTANEIPLALHPFLGKLAAGCGCDVRLYDIGKKRLLRKCEETLGTTAIVRLLSPNPLSPEDADPSTEQTLVVCDALESVRFVRYVEDENTLVAYADDTVRRWVSAACAVDAASVFVADRYGNHSVLRTPQRVSDLVRTDLQGHRLINEHAFLNAAPHRLDLVAHIHAGDIGVAAVRCELVPGGRPVVVVGGIQGSLSVLIPFDAREDADLFAALERAIRTLPSLIPTGSASDVSTLGDPAGLVGRDHAAYRSSFAPQRSIIDGDLCEEFLSLSSDGKAAVAAALQRDVAEVVKKVEEMRIRYAY